MNSYSDILEKIYHLRGGMIDLRLDRMRRVLAAFDHPEKRFPSLHIAGTNGKGSTAAMLHHVLSMAGYRSALYTSPHLVSFTERIRVGADEITEGEVVAMTEEIEGRAAAVALTFFEFVTVMAFVYFARQNVDVAVVEVGLGGRLDATNVVSPMVSAITTLSVDHQAYLGADVFSIAREKAGIIKTGVPVVCGRMPEDVAQLIKAIAEQRGSAAFFLGTDFGFSLKNEGVFDYRGIKQHFLNLTLGLRGRHQRANAAVALAALELARERFPCGDQALRKGLATVRWPGRLEVMLARPTVILDGAHNSEGVQALIDEIRDFPPGRKVKLLFGAMADKEWDLMVGALSQVVDEIVFTRVAMARSAEPEKLAEGLKRRLPHRAIRDSRTALRVLVDESGPEDIIVVAGSLYLLGEIRPMLEQLASQSAAGAVDSFTS
jgi:dihydrofolate synthase / folylpolyglutamate synthase